MVVGKLDIYMQKNGTGPTHKNYLIPLTKINSKWVKDLHVIPESTKLLEENTEKKPLDIGLGSNFLDKTPKAKAKKAKINK